MRKIRIFIATLAVFMGLSGAVPAVALAATSKDTVCTALGSNASCTSNPHGSTTVNNIIKVTVNILSFIVGIAAVIMIIVGGFRFVTAGGDASNVSAAKNTIIYAIVGLVVAASAQALVHFVLSKL